MGLDRLLGGKKRLRVLGLRGVRGGKYNKNIYTYKIFKEYSTQKITWMHTLITQFGCCTFTLCTCVETPTGDKNKCLYIHFTINMNNYYGSIKNLCV